MSGFLTKCIIALDDVDDGGYTVMAPLVYRSDIAKQDFTVPQGFRANGASVPRIPIAFELFGDTSEEAATLHDFLYDTQPVSRAMCDAVLREASQATGVPGWRRWPMWLGVRLFGGSPDHWKPQTP